MASAFVVRRPGEGKAVLGPRIVFKVDEAATVARMHRGRDG
jgi:hypothetical protein